VTCLNEYLFFVSSAVLADSFVLRICQLLKPAKRCRQWATSQYLKALYKVVFMNNNYPWTTFLVILTILLSFTAFLIGSVSPGNYDFGIVVFPWTFIQSLFQEKINFLFILLGLIQLPIYGFVIDNCLTKKYKLVTSTAILLIHFLLVAIIVTFGSKNLVFP